LHITASAEGGHRWVDDEDVAARSTQRPTATTPDVISKNPYECALPAALGRVIDVGRTSTTRQRRDLPGRQQSEMPASEYFRRIELCHAYEI
jgi:hypothetical protein